MSESLRERLPPRLRLALAYAPGDSAARWLGLLALDQRLAATARGAREPMLAQIKLAWWRERLAAGAEGWPAGEPLFAALADWPGEVARLLSLVDGWEEMIAPAPLDADAFRRLAGARAEAVAGIADHPESRRMAESWAIADLASRVSHPQERGLLEQLAHDCDWRSANLPATMRPLAVLHALAARDLRRGHFEDRVSPMGLATALRVGLLGF